jgi:type VI secretion system protein
MTGYGSLFERLGGDADKRIDRSREVCAMASVAAHLAKMLSTRAGSVQTLSDYGLPDLNDMRLSLHDSLSQARLAIDDQLRLYFSIEGLLEVEGFRRQVSFAACLDGSGQVNVS